MSHEQTSRNVDTPACKCGFPIVSGITGCVSCEHREALEILRRTKSGEPVSVLFTGVAASPVEVGGRWYWTIDKNFGDTEFEGGNISVQVTGASLEKLLNLGDLDAGRAIAQLERFDQGAEIEEILK